MRTVSASVEALQSTVVDTVSQLEQRGLLTAEALGQMFTSVSDILNTETNRDQRDARMEVTVMFVRVLPPVKGVVMLTRLSLPAQTTNVDQNDQSPPGLIQ